MRLSTLSGSSYSRTRLRSTMRLRAAPTPTVFPQTEFGATEVRAQHGDVYVPGVRMPGGTRDTRGRIERSAAARDSFMRSHPCPSTGGRSGACPDYVVDHVVALKHGGADAPSNMEWQTIQASKAKDSWE